MRLIHHLRELDAAAEAQLRVTLQNGGDQGDQLQEVGRGGGVIRGTAGGGTTAICGHNVACKASGTRWNKRQMRMQ